MVAVNRRGMIRCALAAVLFGVSTPAVARLGRHLGSFSLAGLLYLGAALAVLPFAGRRRPTREAVRRGLPRLAVAIVVGGAFGPVLLAIGLHHTPSATASLLLNLELVFTTVLASVWFHEYLGWRVVAGTLLVVAAGVLLGWSNGASLRWGAVLIAGACVCWAVDNTVTAHLDELAPTHITLVKGLAAGSANLLIGLGVDGFPHGWPIFGALFVGAIGYGASITLWVAGARDLGAARGQLVFATAPFLGAVVAWTVFGEPVLVREVLSLIIAMAGVSFVLRSGHEHAHVHQPVEHDHEHAHDDGHHVHIHVDSVAGFHQHPHRHEYAMHAHPHVPDLQHRHDHP